MEAPRIKTERHAAMGRGNQASGAGPDREVPREVVIGSKGSEDLQGTLLAPSDSELKRLDEEELMAAIKSAWKKHERHAKKDMAPLLYWLRKKDAAQGNGLSNRNNGVGEWFSHVIEILQRTLNHWANEYESVSGLDEEHERLVTVLHPQEKPNRGASRPKQSGHSCEDQS